ncbi:MAG: alkaline phosphatase family protein, partial [Bacteroidota bacterium]|nr:alkaline phosphatase family protein [Bacteroidota bacterium]
IEYSHYGTTHGSGHWYDRHIPLLWYGYRIPQGSSSRPVSITDIAPTLSALLRIASPSGTTGKPVMQVLY